MGMAWVIHVSLLAMDTCSMTREEWMIMGMEGESWIRWIREAEGKRNCRTSEKGVLEAGTYHKQISKQFKG